MTHDDIIVSHGKIKPIEPTNNTSTENPTQKSAKTIKEVSSHGLLIMTTIFILIQTYVFTC